MYDDLRSYLRSFFNALEAWQPDQDEDGWRIPAAEDRAAFYDHVGAEVDVVLEDCPETVAITEDLIKDIDTLLAFWKSTTPAVCPVQPKSQDHVAYICGDAAGYAFGAGTQNARGDVRVQHKLWVEKDSEQGSNWRESRNLGNQILRDL